jgi:hypothetical protein
MNWDLKDIKKRFENTFYIKNRFNYKELQFIFNKKYWDHKFEDNLLFSHIYREALITSGTGLDPEDVFEKLSLEDIMNG